MKLSLKAILFLLFITLVPLSGISRGQAHAETAQTTLLLGEARIQVLVFWMDSCPHCHHILENVLPPLQKQYGSQLEIGLIELKSLEDVDKLYQVASLYGIEPGLAGVPFVIIGEHALVGSQEIPQKLPRLIEYYLTAGGVNFPAQLDLTSIELLDPLPVVDEDAIHPTGQDQEAASEPSEKVVNVYFFWGDGCPHCAAQKPFMQELSSRFPGVVVKDYEVWFDDENRQIFFDMAAAAGFEPQAVPTTFIGEKIWSGFYDGMKRDIEAAIIDCLESTCPDPGMGITGSGVEPSPVEVLSPILEGSQPGMPAETFDPSADVNLLTLPLIGEINLNTHSLAFSTAMIAFVDGFNPCSLWVLSILLALVIHSGSRRKTLLVGLTFLLVTAGVYGLFITGLFKVFTIVSFIGWIQIVVALLALGFALVNIKDYFWYKEGISFTISAKHKPKIYRDFRAILAGDKSVFALIGATIAMALGIALVELPCTAGFPVLWSKLVSAQEVSSLSFALLLGLYMLVYLLDELLIFVTAVVTLKVSKMEEKQGRVLKLVGGVVMLALALVLLFNPDLMNNFSSSLLIFIGAFGLTAVILLLHRVVLPRFGIVIGTEQASSKTKAMKSKASAE